MSKNNKVIEEYPVGTIFDNEEIEAVKRVLESGDSLTRGKDVNLFEKEFAEYVGAKYAVSTSSCGAALHIANQLAQLNSGDEVICQANAFWVTIINLIERNVTIKVADIDSENLNIDPKSVKKLISPKTKAIYVMHHGGNPADMNYIREIAKQNNIIVIEDAAHAIGAEYKGKKIGANSDIACFSFSSLKNMSTLGEGGMIVTNNDEYKDIASKLRTNWPFGRKVKNKKEKLGEYFKPKSVAFMHAGDAWDYDWIKVDEFGSTFRMSSPQAAVGRIQLKKLDKHNLIREKIANRYNETIKKSHELRTTKVLNDCKNSWHLFTFFVNKESNLNRDKLIRDLDNIYNIKVVTRFWPIHLGGIMRMRGHHAGECPVCEEVWFNEQMSLPISPQMEEWELRTIEEALNDLTERKK